MNAWWIISLIILLPVASGITEALFKTGGRVATFSLLITWFLSVFLLFQDIQAHSFSWLWLPGFELTFNWDAISAWTITLVLFISFLVQFFSQGYMAKDPGIHRYFAKLGLFITSMIGLVLADHLLLLFAFWELVGLSSYLLIGFWYKKEGIPSSARMAFMVNRVAEAVLLSGIILVFNQTGDWRISELQPSLALLTSVLLAVGAFGKSAQLPFSGWLTKAMVGPTPVSALIHAATMVAAGVYLLIRLAPALHPDALTMIAMVGALTALFGGVSALNQYDIKKILAFSTISQLGYMMIGIGVGARQAAFFHLFTHAFFKAGLFLGAASIIHWLHQHSKEDAQDIRFMGSLREKLPWTFRTFLICSLALMGVPLFSGFMSKEGIILAAWHWAGTAGNWTYLVPDLALITVMLTAFYVIRMLTLVFLGEARTTFNGSSALSYNFNFPLIVLAGCSFWIFHNLNPLAHEGWLESATFGAISGSNSSVLATTLSLTLLLGGGTLAYALFKPGTEYSEKLNLAITPQHFLGKVVFHSFYISESYRLFGRAAARLADMASYLDHKVLDRILHLIAVAGVVLSKMLALVDRFLVDGPVNWVASFTAFLGRRLAGMSARDTQTQLVWLLLVIILILSWIIFF
ncbi:MAG: hypothetical protein Tsb0034_25590 [Ekhidna sp.]